MSTWRHPHDGWDQAMQSFSMFCNLSSSSWHCDWIQVSCWIATRERFFALPGTTRLVLRYYPHLTVEKKPCSLLVKLLSFSLVTHCSYPTVKPPPTQLFCGYFTHTFTPDTSYNSTRLVCYLYRIARKFGGGFNLAVWRIVSTSPILNSRQI